MAKGFGFLLILLIIFGSLIIMYPLTVLVGQIGHAIAGLLLTNDKVLVVVGWGKKLIINIGKVTFWLSVNYPWFGHTYLSGKKISPLRTAVFKLSGPCFALLAGSITVLIGFSNDFTTSIKWPAAFFFFDTVLYFIVSLVPSRRPKIILKNGPVYNEGRWLEILWETKKLQRLYKTMTSLIKNGDYQTALKLVERAYKQYPYRHEPFSWIIVCYFNAQHFDKSVLAFQEYEKKFMPNSRLYNVAGLACSFQKNYEEGIEFYKKALETDPDNVETKSYIGFTHLTQERFNEAIIIFNELLENNPQSSYLLSNRGLARFKSGNETEGLADMKAALELPEPDAYAFRNMGIYHLEKNEKDKAITFFEKAKEMAQPTHLLEEYIEKAGNIDRGSS